MSTAGLWGLCPSQGHCRTTPTSVTGSEDGDQNTHAPVELELPQGHRCYKGTMQDHVRYQVLCGKVESNDLLRERWGGGDFR